MKENKGKFGFSGLTIESKERRIAKSGRSAFRVSGCQLPSGFIEEIVIDSAWDAPMIESRFVEEDIEFRFPDEHGPGYLDRLSSELKANITPISPHGLGWKVIYLFVDCE